LGVGEGGLPIAGCGMRDAGWGGVEAAAGILLDGEMEGWIEKLREGGRRRMVKVGKYAAARLRRASLACGLVELAFRLSMTEMRVDTGRGRRIT
jgi:hypothetical protein